MLFYYFFEYVNGGFSEFLVFYIDNETKKRKKMKKVILFMVGVLASLMLSAQSRWSVTPEARLGSEIKENEGTSVTLGFKAGAGVLYQLKEGVGKKAFFWLEVPEFIS